MHESSPADLAKFTHPVLEGVILPAGTEHVIKTSAGFDIRTCTYDHEQTSESFPRWTAEPLPAPEPTLAERARALTESFSWTATDMDNLATIVAELAEKVEGDR